MVMVVPTVGKPGCPGCDISSFTAATFVTGCAREMTAMSFSSEGEAPGTKSGCRTKLVMPTPGLEMGLNDIVGIPKLFGTKQCAAVRIVRESLSEPVHCEPEIADEYRLTT
jgi:hypothetical protein